MKHALLITYYWPPSGGAGVHRWLRFSRYFNKNGVDLTVYCPENAAWPVIDPDLEHQVPEDLRVIRRTIFEPHKYLSKGGNAGVGFTQEKDPSFLQKSIVWIRGNLFIPDSRVFWIKPSVRYLRKYLKDHPEITTLISTGPPHSTHLIARELKKELGLNWIADFRDPWTQIDFYDKLAVGNRADKKHKTLEKLCLTEADVVVTVSNSCASGLAQIGNREIKVISNGYEFPEFDVQKVELDKDFSIVHFGSMPDARNPETLWMALSELINEKGSTLKDHLKVRLIGTVDFQVISGIERYGLAEFIEIKPPVSHKQSIEMQRSSQLLLLVANNTGNVKGILTGKFFEYLGAKRPIIAIGADESDLQTAINNTGSGDFIPFGEKDLMKEVLLKRYSAYLAGSLFIEAKNTGQFNSAELAKEFTHLIK